MARATVVFPDAAGPSIAICRCVSDAHRRAAIRLGEASTPQNGLRDHSGEGAIGLFLLGLRL